VRFVVSTRSDGRRFLSSIRTLAQVRKLITAPMQVNIAEQQVNISR
jgi:hypothetical protein